jgi:hypothetical protein
VTVGEAAIRLKELLLEMRALQAFSHDEVLELFDRLLVEDALDRTSGNISQAARLYGRHRNIFTNRMKRFGITRKQFGATGSRGPYRRNHNLGGSHGNSNWNETNPTGPQS